MLFIYTCSIYFMVLLTFFIMFRLNTRVLDRLAKIKIHSHARWKKGRVLVYFQRFFDIRHDREYMNFHQTNI